MTEDAAGTLGPASSPFGGFGGGGGPFGGFGGGGGGFGGGGGGFGGGAPALSSAHHTLRYGDLDSSHEFTGREIQFKGFSGATVNGVRPGQNGDGPVVQISIPCGHVVIEFAPLAEVRMEGGQLVHSAASARRPSQVETTQPVLVLFRSALDASTGSLSDATTLVSTYAVHHMVWVYI